MTRKLIQVHVALPDGKVGRTEGYVNLAQTYMEAYTLVGSEQKIVDIINQWVMEKERRTLRMQFLKDHDKKLEGTFAHADGLSHDD